MDKQLRITLLLLIDSVFAVVELVAGYAVHSLALVADSFHMFNDILSLIVALWAVKAAKSGTSATFSYGLQRAEILGALVNAVFLLALCVTIFLEAIQRFIDPPEITNPVLILVVGCFGLLSNFVGLFLFNEHGHSHGGGGFSHSHGDLESSGTDHSHDHSHSSNGHSGVNHHSGGLTSLMPESALAREERLLLAHHESYGATNSGRSLHRSRPSSSSHVLESEPNAHEEHHHSRPRPASEPSRSMNMEGVFLHVLGDALGNVGVIATALFIWKTNFSWRFYFDPVVSLLITGIIFSTALPLCMRASKVLLQATPSSVNCDEVAQDIQSLPGVEEIHDLHIWQLSENQLVATLHVTIDGPPSKFSKLTATIQECLHDYGIPSITIQPEFTEESPGHSAPPVLCKAKSSSSLRR